MVRSPKNRGGCVPNANMTQFKLPDPWPLTTGQRVHPLSLDHHRASPPLSCMSRFGFIVIVIMRSVPPATANCGSIPAHCRCTSTAWSGFARGSIGNPGTRHAGTNDEARPTETRSSAPSQCTAQKNLLQYFKYFWLLLYKKIHIS